MNIYVGNLPKTVTEEAIRNVFAEYGEVTDVKLIKDPISGELKGFGFVRMPSKADAMRAIQEVNGREFEGRVLAVNVARPRTNNTPGYTRGDVGPRGFGRRFR